MCAHTHTHTHTHTFRTSCPTHLLTDRWKWYLGWERILHWRVFSIPLPCAFQMKSLTLIVTQHNMIFNIHTHTHTHTHAAVIEQLWIDTVSWDMWPFTWKTVCGRLQHRFSFCHQNYSRIYPHLLVVLWLHLGAQNFGLSVDSNWKRCTHKGSVGM